jgi:hypothetical protein
MSEDMVKAGKRLAIVGGSLGEHWFHSYSPRNGNDFAEGQWCQWVHLARLILADERTKRDMPTHYREYDAPHLYDEAHPDCEYCRRESEQEPSP